MPERRNIEQVKAFDEARRKISLIQRRKEKRLSFSLDLSGLGLAQVPSEILQLTHLTVLDLSRNQLSEVPPEISKLTLLAGLNLSNNRLTELTPEISHLTFLASLDVSGNQLKELPSEISQLTALTGLNLSRNLLRELLPEIGRLTTLSWLILSGNRLRELPAEIGRLTALTRLSLTANQLRGLPPEIGRLTALVRLSLTANQVRELPPEIGQLTALKELYLNDNRLTALPAQIGRLAALERLFLHGNINLGLPEEVLGPDKRDVAMGRAKPKASREILNYYFAIRGGSSVALREMKLIVVGWGKAGKTTLIKRLAGEPMDSHEPETHGILIRPLTLDCSDGELAARVWDFGGQHVLHAMHEFFLTARSLYLLVLEQRSDRAETDAKYWLQLIRSYAPFAPVVVAMNKSRGVERPLDRESLETIYGPIVAWVPTECLAEEECSGAEQTILNLRAALTVASEEQWLPEPRKRFPGKWVKIKEWLESLDRLGKNYLDYETFARECTDRGEPDPAKQAEVAALMHDLGIAMNYARDERLRDTTVLRPDWLANGIYAVLRANLFLPGKLLVPDAVLTPEKLGEIYSVAGRAPVEMLNSTDYPAEKWEFLLRLMNLFQLCFPLSVDGRRQLCPTLLGAELPPQTDEPQGEDRVQLRYEFPVVPAPLLPRFVVRTFSLVEQGKLWQRGTMLRYVEAVARVWTTAEEKYLFATVAGPEEDRADLLAIVRGTLTELIREYRDLAVTEQRWFDGQWVPRATLEKFGVLTLEKGTGAGRPEVVL